MPATTLGPRAGESGFTLIELMVSLTLLMVVSGTVLKGVMDMARINETVTNRTDLHNGVRNATELLTQEVGQAGRVSLPAAVTLTAAAGLATTALTVSSTAGMFAGERIVVDTGASEETVTIGAVNSATALTVSATARAHAANAPVTVRGGFGSGIVPDTIVNGSTGGRLKIYGDINGDGRMVYIEYWCDIGDDGFGRLYRNVMAFNAGAKLPPGVEQILIDNIQVNPDNTPCFTYQRETVNGTTYIVDVAITLTVRTQRVDPVTRQRQTETKALLNVSPRNVFNVWELASLGITNRLQPMPASVQALLP